MKVYIYLLYTDFYSKGDVNLKIYLIKRIYCNLPIVRKLTASLHFKFGINWCSEDIEFHVATVT